MLFGDHPKMLRKEKEITQKQLGKIINISDRVIGYYESNNRFPKDEILWKSYPNILIAPWITLLVNQI